MARQILVFILLLAVALPTFANEDRNLAVTHTDAPANETRVALVIGNSAYKNSPLKNPVNDARAVSAKLRAFGFTVIERENLSQKQIGSTLREFRSRLVPGAVALFFYAGHGLQVQGTNYLPVVDADIASEEDVSLQSIEIGKVLQLMDESKTRLNLVFLDACRNNPYARSFRSAADGLAKVSAPSGTLISFATRPGSVAADGSGKNGLYTEQLLAVMDIRGLPIELALKRIVAGVKAASKGRQEPWMEGSIEGDFYFRAQDAQAANLKPEPVAPSGDFSLDDIKKQQENRAKWDQWQAGMKKAFDETAAFSGASDLQAIAWGRFLANYMQDNPFSGEDEQLRADAQTRKQAAESESRRQQEEAEQKRHAAQAQPTPATITTGGGFRDCPTCPEMVVIPAGRFMMGSRKMKLARLDSEDMLGFALKLVDQDYESPLHRVKVKAFAIGKYEVTNGQFAAFINETGYDAGNDCYKYRSPIHSL